MENAETSPPLSVSDNKANSNAEVQDGDFAFPVQSQDSLSQQTAPDTDFQRLVRQKRRRTSPEDHAVLEAEYEKNPKPDKSARMAIVSRVALGEKEVQIWFQNRRQMTRRKSRPLLPHEIMSNFYSSQGCPSVEPTSSHPTDGSSQPSNPSSQSSVFSSQTAADSFQSILPMSEATSDSVDDPFIGPRIAKTSGGLETGAKCQDLSRDFSMPTGTSNSSQASAEGKDDRSAQLVRSLSQTLPTERRPGYFANRRSASFMIHDEASADRLAMPKDMGDAASGPDLEGPLQPLKRTSSFVRLSLSLDGKAEVTTRTGGTPSPPRSQPAPMSTTTPRSGLGLQRSQSALEPTNSSTPKLPSFPLPRRLMAGRSRDARTWEFYCDSDTRNALTEQAAREESGSATAAISLIRSCSQNKKVMNPNSNKRNPYAQKPESTKRLKPDGQKRSKPKLERATSSVARLQTNTDSQQQRSRDTAQKKLKSGSQTLVSQEGDGDSDKENWAPGTQARSPPRRRTATTHRAGRHLAESLRVPSQSASLDALMHRKSRTASRSATKSSSTEEKANLGSEKDDGVATLIGESASQGVEDLDCVQNLLSLSQAAWQ